MDEVRVRPERKALGKPMFLGRGVGSGQRERERERGLLCL